MDRGLRRASSRKWGIMRSQSRRNWRTPGRGRRGFAWRKSWRLARVVRCRRGENGWWRLRSAGPGRRWGSGGFAFRAWMVCVERGTWWVGVQGAKIACLQGGETWGTRGVRGAPGCHNRQSAVRPLPSIRTFFGMLALQSRAVGFGMPYRGYAEQPDSGHGVV